MSSKLFVMLTLGLNTLKLDGDPPALNCKVVHSFPGNFLSETFLVVDIYQLVTLRILRSGLTNSC